jgi:small subunit ribosomal protein S20
MANIKSQIKRNRQNEKARQRNKASRTALKTAAKKVSTAATQGDAETAQVRAREAARAYDKAASKGVVHKRTAARHKSRLAKTANRAAAAGE